MPVYALFSPISPPPPFRSDCATIAHVLDWFDVNNPTPSKSAEGKKERRRLRELFRDDHGNKLCSICRPHILLDWINEHAGDNRWTRKRWNGTLQRPFNCAAKLGLIDKNPFWGLTFPEGDDGRDWTRDEYQGLLRVCPVPVRRVIVFMLFSGLRPGEVKDLVWPHIKFDAWSIVIREHKTSEKTKAPRKIPLNHVLIKYLKWLRRNVPKDSRNVFLNSKGRPWSTKALTKAIQAARAKAGLPDDVKLHGARHTFATTALMNGVDVLELMELLGHSDIRTTRKYVHLAGKTDHLNKAMEKAIRPRGKNAGQEGAGMSMG